jgi:hypothetical protein
MIKWVVGTMRNVKIAIETASLHGWEYNPANQLHHKKPGASMMHRDSTRQAGGGGKTAKKPASAPAPPLCNSCGGNHTTDECRRKGFPDTNPDVSVKWVDNAMGKAWKERHGCNWRPGGPTVTLDNYVKKDERSKKKARTSTSSSGSRKTSKSLDSSCACLNCQQDVDGDVRCATRVADIVPYGQSEHCANAF